MNNDSLRFTKIVCVVLVITQTLILLIPREAFVLYGIALWMRPVVFAALAAAIVVFMGFDLRPVRKVYNANLVVVLSAILFGITVLIVSLLFGAGRNSMTVHSINIARNVWSVGVVVVLGEFIRYKLIKAANYKNRSIIIFLLTIVLAYCYMAGLHTFLHGDMTSWDAFFGRMFLPIVVSAVASYFAIEGSFLSVVLFSLLYLMAGYLLPVLPNIHPIPWVLICSALVFVTALIYRFVISDTKRVLRQREKRGARYAKRPVLFNVLTAVVLVLLIAFFVGEFPIYPVVVLTDSMEGTFDRGSIVFVERVPQGEAFVRVGEGYIIHFLSRGRVAYVHRVVDFRHNAYGAREYITQGDNTPVVDPFPVQEEEILGIVRASMRWMGWPYIIFQTVLNAAR